MTRILLAGGGTGGHLFPGLALADELHRRAPESWITFIGTREGLDRRLVPAHGYALDCISAARGTPLDWRKPQNALRFLLALEQSLTLVGKDRPDVLIALGGYAAAPPGMAAALRGVPLVVLEQNAVPGRVNRLLARWATQVHLQFRSARAGFGPTRTKFFDSGSPLRAAMVAMARRPVREGKALLVVGGSQGAERLNDLMLEAAPALKRALKCPLIHIAGADNEAAVRRGYESRRVKAEVHGFVDDMAALYRRAKLAVSRAGAGSLAELAAAGVPALLVPLPTAKDDHQWHNAKWLESRGGARVLDQRYLEAEDLADALEKLWRDAGRLAEMADAMRRSARPEAAEEIAGAVLRLIGRESEAGEPLESESGDAA